ncbi:MAG: hypothetical protein KQ78_01660 [Candidatus Izimaplasma bacterium HR2]|nr:MAG: hypothetical protein KQ78_01660 [Candidatus Izimaplasma bacterium HR2]
MFKKVALILGLILFTLTFSFFMTLIGMFVGGNFFTELELFGAIGYEAGGNLGLLLGLVIGITLSLYFYLKLHIKNKQN